MATLTGDTHVSFEQRKDVLKTALPYQFAGAAGLVAGCMLSLSAASTAGLVVTVAMMVISASMLSFATYYSITKGTPREFHEAMQTRALPISLTLGILYPAWSVLQVADEKLFCNLMFR